MLGLIGGSGLYKLEGLSGVTSKECDTPFGKPSAAISLGKLSGKDIAFLPRHGTGHHCLPSDINYRANIWALKSVGVTEIISVSACGSLREEIKPGELAVPNQYFDWTRGKRQSTFFGDGIVAHVSSADPACSSIIQNIKETSRSIDQKVHFEKAYACVEGPRFGSRVESFFLRNNGLDIVGMTNVPEAFLAREAQICYATIGVVTDYDCWMEDPAQHATVDKMIALYMETLGKVQTLIHAVIGGLASETFKCACRKALQGAVLTQESAMTPAKKEFLAFLQR